MSRGALDDSEIQSEMNKMVAFISQEAREKAREIQVKADEEFAIEKAKIVRQEQLAIDAQYEKKRKQAEVGWKIAQSTALNQSRLEVLRKRDEQLQDLFEEANKKVKELADGKDYPKAMTLLITEILLLLLSKDVTLAHRPKDKDLVKKSAEEAKKQYKEISGLEAEITFDDSLADDSAGGVIGSTMGDRIKVDNTLSARLHILEEKMLPELREDLFGKNPNRKFYTEAIC
ncbi:vacuolar ATP synthase subunit E [Cutaneotrichosporon oleaginosum]|uniref:Vacuolar ATP synthase subunit E n=1 Tax=Cutaneotrichosporon oleaginosum TaxID=879819 RepID=A0A0J0XY90_9TREE|nr:vacuolar ATP synthase subunit E [Cutaneotrichosporon oleaginosum]KLT46012.1 vacuolar ATP synthase subunit E [Cutaneotrichosporon oleaginosum]